jgi:hypothetical protein
MGFIQVWGGACLDRLLEDSVCHAVCAGCIFRADGWLFFKRLLNSVRCRLVGSLD